MMNYTDKYELWLNRADEKTVCELKKMNDNEITECFTVTLNSERAV